ncbi:MAG: cbb3-type cytochrome oxidase assembly protein CcoS [Hellea sp.]|nr:cbb3-type cytochrome oxidase assembly protein CcoS [Hellea sp.]
MTALFWLIPIAIGLGLLGLKAFFWSVKNGQFDDAKGDAQRILTDEDFPIIED